MKKVLSIAAASLVILGMSSCKKDYTCKCSGNFLGTAWEETYDLGKQKKSDAEDACAVWNTQATAIGGSCSAEKK